jgi:tetratricopeptide (TPR) repeat protein
MEFLGFDSNNFDFFKKKSSMGKAKLDEQKEEVKRCFREFCYQVQKNYHSSTGKALILDKDLQGLNRNKNYITAKHQIDASASFNISIILGQDNISINLVCPPDEDYMKFQEFKNILSTKEDTFIKFFKGNKNMQLVLYKRNVKKSGDDSWDEEFRFDNNELSLGDYKVLIENLAKLQLLVRLGNIYDEIGNAASAVKYLEEAQAIAEGLEDSRYHVDVLVKLANIYFKKNEIEKTLQYIKSCERLLYRADMLGKYPKGYLRCKEVQARVYLIKQDYERVREICIRGISLCGEEYFKLKGLFYKNLGNSYIETGKIEKALDCYEKSLSCFERRNYPICIRLFLRFS